MNPVVTLDCPLCDFSNGLAFFINHLWYEHPGILLHGGRHFNIVQCPVCDLGFGGTNILSNHLSNCHTTEELRMALHAKILNIQPGSPS